MSEPSAAPPPPPWALFSDILIKIKFKKNVDYTVLILIFFSLDFFSLKSPQVLGDCWFPGHFKCTFLSSFCLFRASPAAYGASQARSPIGAVVTGLHHGHSNARSEPRLQPTPQLMAMPDP